jgi:hypothetical protein
MAVLEVWINGESRAVAGGRDFDVLTFGVLKAIDTSCSVAILTGSNRSTGDTLQWLNAPLRSGDTIRAVVRASGDGSGPPTSKALLSSMSLIGDAQPPCTWVVRSCDIVVRVSGDARRDMLATLTWHHLLPKAKLEVACMPPSEKDLNQCWMETQVAFDEPVAIDIT